MNENGVYEAYSGNIYEWNLSRYSKEDQIKVVGFEYKNEYAKLMKMVDILITPKTKEEWLSNETTKEELKKTIKRRLNEIEHDRGKIDCSERNGRQRYGYIMEEIEEMRRINKDLEDEIDRREPAYEQARDEHARAMREHELTEFHRADIYRERQKEYSNWY